MELKKHFICPKEYKKKIKKERNEKQNGRLKPNHINIVK